MCERSDDRIIETSDKRVADVLIGEDTKLRFGVLIHRMVPVEMVGRYVEDERHARLERADRLELKRRYFGDHPIVGGGFRRFGDQRVSDISADVRRLSGTAKECSDERGRRRLPFGPGNRDDRRLADAIGNFDFTENRNACVLNAANERAV